jgi:hypothetical protein
MARTIINEVSIRKKFVDVAKAPRMTGFMRNAANTRFQIARQVMLEEFDSNEITDELKQNPSEPGSSLVSKGNLVSFLGLEDGKTEVANVREFIRENTDMSDEAKISVQGNKINFGFKVSVPSKTQVFEAFPAPDGYSSKSWLEIIETGIGSATKYIFWSLGFDTPASRSGTGLQSKGNVKNVAKFTPKPYISTILEKFFNKFK